MAQKDWLHKEYPKALDPDDFWGQVKRTVNGVPVSREQIMMIVDAIRNALCLTTSDHLLDLGCGNGALSQYLFPCCKAFLGVDFSAYLIKIAKSNFERKPFFQFIEQDAELYVLQETRPDSFTRVLCYGSFSYFPQNKAEAILKVLYRRFSNVQRFFIGNLPDLDRIHRFYTKGTDYAPLIKDSDAPLGIWRTTEEIHDMARNAGWKAEIRYMPSAYYAAHYRYDVLLTRNQGTEKHEDLAD